ncbi:Flp1 family type IVb pilin [Bdellovibrio sp. HCB-110]|uniref:Flp1 family type IVb pilin n=1 Tax=Bdellovibrio sp. HCB-110 TaxID=3391182 RepID=UPI0039B4D33D
MKKFKNFSKNLLKKESGQGATEYILLLVVVVALVLMFKGKITAKLEETMGALSGSMDNVINN